MKLYVIRHAEATSAGANERCLTEKGERQAMDLGAYFKEHSINPDVVLASPVLRAKQTAQILCDAAAIGIPSVESWLSCGMAPEVAKRELKVYAELDSVVIVGHEPDLSFFLLDTLGAFQHPVKKASLTIVDNYQSAGVRATLADYLRF